MVLMSENQNSFVFKQLLKALKAARLMSYRISQFGSHRAIEFLSSDSMSCNNYCKLINFAETNRLTADSCGV